MLWVKTPKALITADASDMQISTLAQPGGIGPMCIHTAQLNEEGLFEHIFNGPIYSHTKIPVSPVLDEVYLFI